MSSILEVNHISKKYLIRKAGQQPYLNLRDSLAGFFRKSEHAEFWALNDISFRVEAGESIGIIGKNGAGKSTLLKILSQITPPTNGKITARGRIASLLEVGTGFHAELSGRENIFMNGSILGMSRSEILKNFDEIVSFSGVEAFLDTPLKHYSSGMQLRLAFAVAAFLENEILIIDEVLAVGDAEFQKKCMGKMGEVSKSGRTVLFVSHNIGAVKSLCSRGLVLNNGKLEFDGAITDAVSYYQQMNYSENQLFKSFESDPAYQNEHIQLVSIKAGTPNTDTLTVTQVIPFEITFNCFVPGINLDCTMEFRTIDEIIVFQTGALISTNRDSENGQYQVSFQLPGYYLNAGEYAVSLIFGKDQRIQLFAVDTCYFFSIENDAVIGSNNSHFPGVLRPNFDYTITHSSFKD